MEKSQAYKSLVDKRKSCSLCSSLYNPATVANGIYDSTEIGPWSRWQGNLDAELVIVGEDWGDVSYFVKHKGRDQSAGNPTNENLQKLLEHIGIKIGKPRDHQGQLIFFTNLILCLKEGGLQAPIKDKRAYANCANAFFKPLMEIINPRIIISLGGKASKAILNLYNHRYRKSSSVLELTAQSPYKLDRSTYLFCCYHCGARVVNTWRPMHQQKEDWSRVSEWGREKLSLGLA